MSGNNTLSYIHEHNIMVPMRDGVRLATDVFRPQREGRWPVLLTRIPYNKDVRARDFQVALNRIYHDADHPSYLILPIIERSKLQENA